MRIVVVVASLAVLIIAVLGACAEPKVANRCAGDVNPPCLTRVVCSFDQKRGCEVCTCDSALPPAAPSGEPTVPPLQ
jgi:hypothetical protein